MTAPDFQSYPPKLAEERMTHHQEEDTMMRRSPTGEVEEDASSSQQQQQQRQQQPPGELSKAQQRVYSKSNLEAFNLLEFPIWVFDMGNKAMWWANDSACYLWDAPDCDSLCQRDFAVGMSKANEHSLNAWLERLRFGETNERTWTIHPNGGKDGPRTCIVKLSGIFVSSTGDEKDKRFCMLVTCKNVIDGKSRDQEEAKTIRRTEMLRHFPIVARQFNNEGNLMDQNSEALKSFGSPSNAAPSETIVPSGSTHDNNDKNKPSASSPTSPVVSRSNNNNNIKEEETIPITKSQNGKGGGGGSQQNHHHHPHQSGKASSSSATLLVDPKQEETPSSNTNNINTTTTITCCHFIDQFVDKEEGRQVFDNVTKGNDYSTETQQMTLEGPKWFTVNVRRIQDPVTSEPVIIYSARDITTIMESAKAEADKLNMTRSEFFAVMAHEIRTPLHQVVGFIELLATSGLNAEQTESVDMLQSSAHALMAIINDLLDFTKLEAGKMKLEIIPFQVRGVLDGSVAAVQPQVHEKGLAVECTVDPKIPLKLLGDPNRLRQIVLNMLSNAVKFTNKGGITVDSQRIKKDNGQMTVRFSVKDSGIGIPKDKCDRIFNPYQQADASVSRNFGGTGLGLAICKSLVDNMGGSIGVDSELGKGATFWFEIPFGIITKCQQDATDLLVSKSLHETTSLRILVAEDNKVNQKVVCKMLSRLGHDTVVAENGQEAVEWITTKQQEDSKFDLILMDWQMPVMDGIDATKEIRRKGFSVSQLPIVGLTASIQGLDWSEIGMNDCLKKPIRIADLKASLLKNTVR